MDNIAKQSIMMVVLSVAAMFMQHELAHLLSWLLHVHNVIASGLTVFFSMGPVGKVIQGIIALVLVPALAGGLVAAGFWLVKHVSMPHAMGVIWVMWLVMLVTILAQHV